MRSTVELLRTNQVFQSKVKFELELAEDERGHEVPAKQTMPPCAVLVLTKEFAICKNLLPSMNAIGGTLLQISCLLFNKSR